MDDPIHRLLNVMSRCARSVVPVLFVVAGCSVSSTSDPAAIVDRELLARTGGSVASDADSPLPPGIELADGLSTEEAIAVALWNDAEFLAVLAELGIARADVAQAALVRNPSFSFLFATGGKQAEATLTAPLESWFTRGARERAADRALLASIERVIAHGVRLAASVQEEVAELVVARRVADVRRLHAERALRLAELEEARARLGEGTRDEASAARDRAFDAELDDSSAQLAVDHARRRLGARFGAAAPLLPLDDVRSSEPLLPGDVPEERLWVVAAETRPDARAARYEVEAAREHVTAVRRGRLPVSVIADANSDGDSGWEIGPGLAVELPLFDDGSARVARAEAELLRAERRRDAVAAAAQEEIGRALAELHATSAHAARERAERLPAQLLRRDSARDAFARGVLSELEVARIELASHEAELGALAAELEWQRASAAVMAALGCDPRKLAPPEPRGSDLR